MNQPEVEAQATAEQVASEVTLFIDSAKVPAIQDQTKYDEAIAMQKEARRRAKLIEEKRVELVTPLNETVKKINAFFKPAIERLTSFETGLKRICQSYLDEKEAERLEAQRKADEIARKEREKIEAQARAAREKEAQARRDAEEAERKAAQEQDAKKREALEKEAATKRSAQAAAAEKAEVREAVASTVVAPIISKECNAQGQYTVEKFTAEVKDKVEFVRWALASNMLEYLEINESLLNKESQATKGERKWPGITVSKKMEARRRG